MTAEWQQRFNTYILNSDHQVIDIQALCDAKANGTRFQVTGTLPQGLLPPDKTVFNFGPFDEDRYVAIYCSHLKPDTTDFAPSDPRCNFVRLYPICTALVVFLIYSF